MRLSPSEYSISAIVSTFNAERFIAGCIEDLEAQTIADQVEIIVIDSASEQNEADVVRHYQKRFDNIRYLRTETRETVYGAWNRGVGLANGRYITNANTDDRHRPDAFERMAAVLDSRPHVALVYADVIRTRAENQTFERCDPCGRMNWFDWDRTLLLRKGCFIGPQPMWRRGVHRVFGEFSDGLVTSGDYEFWLRISQIFEFYHLKQPLGLYLERPNSVEHANSSLKPKEDLAIQAEYLQAALRKQLIRCRLLDRLRRLLQSEGQQQSGKTQHCMSEIETLICPVVEGRSMSVRNETDNFLELKYRILSGMVSPAQVGEVIDEFARLMLISTRWFNRFWEEAASVALLADSRDKSSEPARTTSSSGPRCKCGTGNCAKSKCIAAS